ncbi:hypothetical protein ACRAWB_01910 [Leifsonia poae]|uniref:hypothetical protein n=1 Tax=Leifsonia poae TaxID=110933 RepID=UPI003D69E7AF
MSNPNTRRLVGHVLVDAMTSIDPEAEMGANLGAINLALQRLKDIGAADLTYNEESGVQYDATNIVVPALMAMVWLSSRLASVTGTSEEEIYVQLRESFDQA